MKHIRKVFLILVLLTFATRLVAQIPTQNFSWTVTATGTETWTTLDVVYDSYTLTPDEFGTWPDPITAVAPISGQALYTYDIETSTWQATVWASIHTPLSPTSYLDYLTVSVPNGSIFHQTDNGVFTVNAGQHYKLSIGYDWLAAGPPSGLHATLTTQFPNHTNHTVHVATRTASETGNNFVNATNGEKSIGGFIAPPQALSNGVISSVSYSLSCNNPNVVLFFSDTRTGVTPNPNANIVATIAPVPGQVDANFMVMLSNTPALDGTSTMVWHWAPVTYAAGYMAIVEQYVNGAWQTPITNYTSTNAFTFTELSPGAPTGIWFCATNVSGAGPSSLIAWPTAAVPPLPAQVTYLSLVTNVATSYDSATIAVSWRPVNYAAGYQVAFAQYLNGAWQTLFTNNTSTTNYTFNGVTAGAPCGISVYATNYTGIGPVSATLWPTAAILQPPALTGLMVTATNSTSVIFAIPQALSTNYGIAGYYVAGGVTNNFGAGVGSATWAVLSLRPSTTYTFYFYAWDILHWASGPIAITNVTTLPVPTLQGLRVASINATSVRFELPQALSTNYGVQGYYVNGNVTNVFGAGAGPSMWLVGSLQPNTTYTFYHYQVDLVNNYMAGPTISTNVTTLATPITVPALQGLSVVTVNPTSIRFQLAQPLPTNFLVSGYYVIGSVTNPCGSASGAQYWDVNGLQPMTTYTFYFSAYDVINWVNGPYSITNVTTLQMTLQIQTSAANFGIQTNCFGFNIVGLSNEVVVIEASTNLSNTAWVPLLTNTLGTNAMYFSDPRWTNYPSRFYRVHSQ